MVSYQHQPHQPHLNHYHQLHHHIFPCNKMFLGITVHIHLSYPWERITLYIKGKFLTPLLQSTTEMDLSSLIHIQYFLGILGNINIEPVAVFITKEILGKVFMNKLSRKCLNFVNGYINIYSNILKLFWEAQNGNTDKLIGISLGGYLPRQGRKKGNPRRKGINSMKR